MQTRSVSLFPLALAVLVATTLLAGCGNPPPLAPEVETNTVVVRDTVYLPPPPPDTVTIVLPGDTLLVREVCAWRQCSYRAFKGSGFNLGSPGSTSLLAEGVALSDPLNTILVRGTLKYLNADDHGGQSLVGLAKVVSDPNAVYPGAWNGTAQTVWQLPNENFERPFTLGWTTALDGGYGLPPYSTTSLFLRWGSLGVAPTTSAQQSLRPAAATGATQTMWHFEGCDSIFVAGFRKVCTRDTIRITRR